MEAILGTCLDKGNGTIIDAVRPYATDAVGPGLFCSIVQGKLVKWDPTKPELGVTGPSEGFVVDQGRTTVRSGQKVVLQATGTLVVGAALKIDANGKAAAAGATEITNSFISAIGITGIGDKSEAIAGCVLVDLGIGASTNP